MIFLALGMIGYIIGVVGFQRLRKRRGVRRRSTVPKRRRVQRDFTFSLTLTEADIRRLMSGQHLWFEDVKREWSRLSGSAIRFETPSGRKHLKLRGLEEDDYCTLHSMCYCAQEAAGSAPEADRIHAWAERLEDKFLRRADEQSARMHWWLGMDAEDRAFEREQGGSWRDHRQY